jgi:hypothetical protein
VVARRLGAAVYVFAVAMRDGAAGTLNCREERSGRMRCWVDGR